MASPVVQQAIENATSTAGTSHVITLPTATSGQLLLIILDKGSTSATINAHGSLTELLDEASANGLYIAYRWMDGTEPASYTLTSSASTRSASIAYRISGAENPATQAPQIGTTATGTSATPDPPASATPASSKDYLFIAFAGMAGEEADDDTWGNTPPTNYTPSPPRQKSCGVAGTNLGGLILSAERALTTGSAENPGTFGVDVSAAWRAQTIMVHPAAAVTHATTGALTGPGTTIAGSASSATTRASSGALTGPGAVIVGSAARTHAHPSSGVITGPGAAIVGAANRGSTGPVTHATNGVLAGQGAAIVGDASSATTRPSSGVIVGPGAAIVGSAARTHVHPTSGEITGPGTVVVGSAARLGAPVTHETSGEIAGAGASIAGSAAKVGVASQEFTGFYHIYHAQDLRRKYKLKDEDEEEEKKPIPKKVRAEVSKIAKAVIAERPRDSRIDQLDAFIAAVQQSELQYRAKFNAILQAEADKKARQQKADEEDESLMLMLM